MDTLKSLLVHVDATPHSEARLRVARKLVERHGGSMSACYAVTPAFVQIPLDFAGSATAVGVMQEIDEQRLGVARGFVERLRKEPGPAISWQQVQGIETIRAFAEHALYADLLVFGQHDPELTGTGVQADFVESVLIAGGRPGLVVPYIDPSEAVGERVLIAWKPTPSSMNAVRGALPFLAKAREVHVASWTGGEFEPDSDPTALIGFLQQRDISARLHRFEEAPADIGDLILSLAADLSADLLVMGCYGHSRARELVLGGATRTILASMTIPVLMSH